MWAVATFIEPFWFCVCCSLTRTENVDLCKYLLKCMSVKCEQQTMINSTKSFTSILCRMIIIVHSRRSLSFCVSIYELLLDENEENRRRAIKRTTNDYANKTRTHSIRNNDSLHFVGSREFCFVLKHVDREYVCRLLIIYFDSKD